MKNQFKKAIFNGIIVGFLLFDTMFFANAQIIPPSQYYPNLNYQYNIYGTVTNVNGNTFNVNYTTNGVTNNYTVYDNNAIIYKNNTTTNYSSIYVGDNVLITGIVNGYYITANIINDQINLPSPISTISGQVTGVDGNFLTVNYNGVYYTIDTSNSQIFKNGLSSCVSNILINDQIVSRGILNGNNLIANQVLDNSYIYYNNTPVAINYYPSYHYQYRRFRDWFR